MLYLKDGQGFPNKVLLSFKWWLGRAPSTVLGGNLLGGSVTSMCGGGDMILDDACWSSQRVTYIISDGLNAHHSKLMSPVTGP